MGVHDVHGVSGGRNHERWEEDLLETVTVKEEAAPAPAMPTLASLLPDYYCDNFISKVRRRTDRALTYVSCRGREKNFEAGSWWHAIFDKLVWRGEGIRAAFVNVNLLLFPSRI